MTTVGEYFGRTVDRAGNFSLPTSIHLYEIRFWVGNRLVRSVKRLSTDLTYQVNDSIEEELYIYQTWFDNPSLNGGAIISIQPRTSSINLYGLPTSKIYNITYQVDGGQLSNSAPSTFTIGQSLTLVNPTRPGYTFNGWYLDEQHQTQINVNNLPVQHITLYAKWIGLTTTIYFISQETISPITVQSGQPIGTLPTIIMAEGFTFLGWSLTMNDLGDIIDSDYITDNSLTLQLYPIWSTSTQTAPVNLFMKEPFEQLNASFEIIVFTSTLIIGLGLPTFSILKRKLHGNL
jgi:uncharacterized repeat protein (TIGR02543 family)